MLKKSLVLKAVHITFSFLEVNVELNDCDNVVLHNVIASNEFDVDTKLYYNEQNTGKYF